MRSLDAVRPLDAQTFASLLEPFLSCHRWVIAYSGGLDSHVLLHMVAHLDAGPPLLCLHVNHGLQTAANDWQAHCAGVCGDLSIPFQACAVDVETVGRGGPEDAARRARYGAFEAQLRHDDLLLLAHHADDQAETMLLRLMRGAGARGLAGMPTLRPLGTGRLFRPLLAFTKADLQRYAKQHALRYVNDSSNVDTSLDRNYLRQQVFPLIEKRWPGYTQSWRQSAQWLRESTELEAVLGAQDLIALGWQVETPGGSLCLSVLRRLSPARAKNALRHACATLGLTPPPQQQLSRLLSELPAAKADAQPKISWAKSEARRFAGRLYLLPRLATVDKTIEYQWSGEDLAIPGVGILRAVTSNKPGLARDEQYCIRLRRGGETFKPQPGGHSKLLKKWLQEASVPPWLRDRTPLIFKQGELVAIGELWVSDAHCTRHEAITVRIATWQSLPTGMA